MDFDIRAGDRIAYRREFDAFDHEGEVVHLTKSYAFVVYSKTKGGMNNATQIVLALDWWRVIERDGKRVEQPKEEPKQQPVLEDSYDEPEEDREEESDGDEDAPNEMDN